MMLPSGNDAAITLASFFGNIINVRKLKKRLYVKLFVKAMNKFVFKLGCTKTEFSNPHGMYLHENMSTCIEIGKIARFALKIPFLKEIVKMKTYTSTKINKLGEK